MSTDVATTRPPTALAIKDWDRNFADLIKQTVLKPSQRAATDAELALFAEVVKRTGLDPITRQIYGVFRNDRRAGGEAMTIQVGIDGLRLIAERTTKYEGQVPVQWCDKTGKWTDVWLEADPPSAARAGVYKTGMREPLYAVATWREFRQQSPMWERMGPHMLAKCAEALALRKAFPNETSGLYIPEETGAEIAGAGSGQRPASGGTVTLPTADAEATAVEDDEPPAPAVTADPPAPTTAAASPAQRRLIFQRQKEAGVPDEALRDVFRIVAGTPHSDRISRDRVDEILEVIATIGKCGLNADDASALLREAATVDPMPSMIALCEALDNPEAFWAERNATENGQAELEAAPAS